MTVLLERYFAERKLPAKTETEFRGVVKRFVDQHSDLPVRLITARHVREHKQKLLTTPSQKTGKAPTAATATKLMGLLRALLQYALRQGYVDKNVAEGVSKVATKDDGTGENGRLPYPHEDARKLLEAAQRLSDGDRWLVLLGAYTGARQAELVGLRKSDVRISEDEGPDGRGIPYLAFQPHEGRTLKTKASRRNLTLHSKLVEAGFAQWAQAQDGEKLFPKTPSAFAHRYATFARTVVKDRRFVYHSWRHAFITALRAAEVPFDMRCVIVGHAEGSVHSRYGAGYPLRVLREAIEKVQY